MIQNPFLFTNIFYLPKTLKIENPFVKIKNSEYIKNLESPCQNQHVLQYISF
jgi:hypothetical protein